MTLDIQSSGFGDWYIVNYSTIVAIIVVVNPGIKKQHGHVFKAVVNNLFAVITNVSIFCLRWHFI